ncbi:ABC transporter permease [Afifella sp. IM 167]|uniref:ABC transporter permease n=1 Tax=Afifella sp. IM 167 TaxID=2033586 RepID=UPI001CCA2CF7|nr:ABC transporter permease [Afifella sp. IM 167]MBZ8134458.1 ABC transporter permease [Afifella sp. IM 167]
MSAPAAPVSRPGSPTLEALRMLAHNGPAVVGIAMIATIVAVAAIGPLLYPVDPYSIVAAPLSPPFDEFTPQAPFGTDYLGRDILAGIIHGARPTLLVGAFAAALTVVIGVTIGALAGFYGGWIDQALLRLTEFFQVLPPLLLAMVLVTLFSPSLPTIAISIGIVSWPAAMRLTRGEFLRIRQLDYVKAARAAGARNRRLIWRVILPNALPPLIISAALTIGVSILFEAGLSFLGLGDPNTMTWGLMIGANREYFLDAWWPVSIPGVAIFFTVLSVSLLGDGLNDAFNPKLRRR